MVMHSRLIVTLLVQKFYIQNTKMVDKGLLEQVEILNFGEVDIIHV